MEIIQLYSECFNAGGGLATADAFYAVTSENPLFYKKTNNLGYWL